MEATSTSRDTSVNRAEAEILAIAARIVDEHGRVDSVELAEHYRRPRYHVEGHAARLRKRGLWPYEPMKGKQCGDQHPDPVILARVHAEHMGGMGDGRAEVDDPVAHGAGVTPSGAGRGFRAVGKTPKKLCKAFFHEWQVVTGRRQPRPKDEEKVRYDNPPRVRTARVSIGGRGAHASFSMGGQ